MYGGQATHIPVKVNMSGVMPVIFASSLLAMPQTLSLLFSGGTPNWISSYLTVEGSVGVYVYSILNFILIILFGFFYSSIQFNTVEYAKIYNNTVDLFLELDLENQPENIYKKYQIELLSQVLLF